MDWMSSHMIWRLACFALASASAFGCDANQEAATIVVADSGESLSLSDSVAAPVCRVLTEATGERRGIELNVSRTGSGSLVLARDDEMEGWRCDAAGDVTNASDTS